MHVRTYCFIKLVVGQTLLALLLWVMSRRACCHAFSTRYIHRHPSEMQERKQIINADSQVTHCATTYKWMAFGRKMKLRTHIYVYYTDTKMRVVQCIHRPPPNHHISARHLSCHIGTIRRVGEAGLLAGCIRKPAARGQINVQPTRREFGRRIALQFAKFRLISLHYMFRALPNPNSKYNIR